MGRKTWNIKPGDKFGRGRVLEEIRMPRPGRANGVRGFRLRCDCGSVYQVRLSDLTTTRKPTKSCGCLALEAASAVGSAQANLDRLAALSRTRGMRTATAERNRARKPTHGLARHDGTQHPLYGTWTNMMSRCYNPKVRSYRDYGARGITVCERWHDPRLFIEDIEATIGPRPDGMTLDRTDNDREYGPGKVRWATRAEQVRNSRRFVDGKRSGPVYALWYRLRTEYPDELCVAWQDFSRFAEDIQEIGPRPEGMFFRRADQSRPYQPGNIRWSRSPR